MQLRRRTQRFGYIVQQIEFIIHTNIKPLPAIIFTKGQSQKNSCQRDNLKNKYWFSLIFHVKLRMTMGMT